LQEFSKRHGGRLDSFEIWVSTMTIKHDITEIGDVNAPDNTRKPIWLLALFADEEKDKLGRSFNLLRTKFNVTKGDIFVSYTES
jgi:hypothetical protein